MFAAGYHPVPSSSASETHAETHVNTSFPSIVFRFNSTFEASRVIDCGLFTIVCNDWQSLMRQRSIPVQLVISFLELT